MKITAVCLSPAIQRTVSFGTLNLNQVNRSTKYGVCASGKAINAARVLNQLEASCVRIVCPLGEDNQERFIALAQRDIPLVSAVTIPGNTRICWTLLDTSLHTTTELVVDEPNTEPLSHGKVMEMFDVVCESLSDSDALLFAGSRPSIWPADLQVKICNEALKQNKPVLVDFHGEDLEMVLNECAPTIVKINQHEFFNTFHLEKDNIFADRGDKKLKAMLIEASKKYNTIFIITRGSQSTLAARKADIIEAPSEQNLNIVNTTACGDAFSAGFLHEFIKSADLNEALKKGTWCAARNAETEIPGNIG